MLKKNSWIVALILALSFTALFTGCVDAPVEEGGGVTYTEVPLGEFNCWGGQTYQQGWAVGGLKFSGIGDKIETAADKGYKLEDFQKATRLVIEMEDATHPKGNVDIIWGGEAEDGSTDGIGSWNQTAGIAYKKDGNTITIELPKALKNYAVYRAATTKKVKIVLQAGGEPDKLSGLVKSAKLLIPDVEEPIPPDPYDIDGQGTYTFTQVGIADPDNIAVDLNKAIIGTLTPAAHLPAAKITATGLTATFTWNTQTIFIPFDDYVKPLIKNAAAGGYKFSMTIKGNATDNGKVRVAIGKDDSSGWNVSNLVNGDFNDLASNSGTTTVWTLSASANDLNGIVIQARPLDNANVENFTIAGKKSDGTVRDAIPANTITINSIKIELVPPTSLTAVDTLTMTIGQPIAGSEPAGTQKTVSGTGWSGTVTWVPALPTSGKFTTSTIYRAKVAITANPGYYIDVITSGSPTIAVSRQPKTGPSVVIGGVFDLANFAVVTGVFLQTEAKVPVKPVGIVWELNKDYTDHVDTWNANKWWESYPFAISEYNDRTSITVDDSGDPDVVISTINPRAQNYHGFELFFGDINVTWYTANKGLDLDPSIYKVKITVEGNIDGTVTAGTKFIAIGGNNNGDKAFEITLAGTLNETFSKTVELPKTFDFKEAAADANKKRLRFLTSGGGTGDDKIGYSISKLKVEITGYW